MEEEIVINVEMLSKCYEIYEHPIDRLKQLLVPPIQSLLRKSPGRFYREFWALKEISFKVRKGQTVGIIGRNGAGKSTLLQVLCGTLHPSSGRVAIEGRVAALLELGSGFNPEFTGRENVYLNAAVWGLSRDEVNRRFHDIVEFSEIQEFIDQPVKTYSSGMIMRLAFSVIAHVDAEILIIDEALSVGDAFFTQKCMRFLRAFMEQGTVLFVSHDIGAVLNLCESAIWIQDGKVRSSGKPKELADEYLSALYKSKQDAVVAGEIKSEKISLEEGGDRVDQRMSYINSSKLRNDIELFEFTPDANSFGNRGAEIIDVSVCNSAGDALSWCVGGEDVTLRVLCRALESVYGLIIGFYIKDRLGQTLFGDNTYLSYLDSPVVVEEGRLAEAEFSFRMPILPIGDYSVSAAVAEGTQLDHVQHHWIHDALLFRSHSASVSTGLVGIPMQDVKITVKGNNP